MTVLQGCGGERTAPFNPGSSSSSSSVTSVDATQLTQGTTTRVVPQYKEHSLHVARDQTEFYKYVDEYSTINLDLPDFTTGQVIIVDGGDTDSCKKKVIFNRLTAQQDGNNSVKVVVSYSESADVTTTCTSVISRPYYFYYIKSLNTIIFSEDII